MATQKKITVQVLGGTGVGKSTVAVVLKTALQDLGFEDTNVVVTGNDELDKRADEVTWARRVDALKEAGTQIEIVEKHARPVGTHKVLSDLSLREQEFVDAVDRLAPIGYARMMQLVSRLWRAVDPDGALTVGPTYTSVEADRTEIVKRLMSAAEKVDCVVLDMEPLKKPFRMDSVQSYRPGIMESMFLPWRKSQIALDAARRFGVVQTDAPRRVELDVEATVSPQKFREMAEKLGVPLKPEEPLSVEQADVISQIQKWCKEQGYRVVSVGKGVHDEARVVVECDPKLELSLDPHQKGSFSRFKRVVQEVIVEANKTAIGWGHEYLGTEHLLYGMCMTKNGTALLEACGLDSHTISSQVLRMVRVRDDTALSGHLPLTPRAHAVLTGYALAEAGEGNKIGLREVLVGMLREQHGVAGHVLIASGLTVEKVRATKEPYPPEVVVVDETHPITVTGIAGLDEATAAGQSLDMVLGLPKPGDGPVKLQVLKQRENLDQPLVVVDIPGVSQADAVAFAEKEAAKIGAGVTKTTLPDGTIVMSVELDGGKSAHPGPDDAFAAMTPASQIMAQWLRDRWAEIVVPNSEARRLAATRVAEMESDQEKFGANILMQLCYYLGLSSRQLYELRNEAMVVNPGPGNPAEKNDDVAKQDFEERPAAHDADFGT